MPRVYFTEESVKNFVWEAGMISEGPVRLQILGNLVLDQTSLIYGSDVELLVNGHAISLGKIKGDSLHLASGGTVVLGEVETKTNFIFRAIDAVFINQIKAGGDVDIEVAGQLAVMTLVAVHNIGHQTTSQILAQSGIEAQGKITLAAENIGIQGAQIIGSNVYTRAKDKLFIIPAELYFEAIRYGKKYYSKYRELRMHESMIIARIATTNSTNSTASELIEAANATGNIELSAGNYILMRGGEYLAETSFKSDSWNGTITIEASSPWQSLIEVNKKKRTTSTKITKKTSYNENPSPVEISAPNVTIQSKGDQRLQGIKIIAKVNKLIAGTPEHAASIAILAATKISELEVKTQTKGFTFKFENNGLTFGEIKREGKGQAQITPVPSILQIEEEFYIEAKGGDYIHVQPMFVPDPANPGKLKGRINAENIIFESAPTISTEYSYFNKLGYGIGFSSKKGEYALKAAISFEDRDHSHTKLRHELPMIFGGLLQFNATKGIYTQGILLHANELQVNSQILILGTSVDIETTKNSRVFLEGGVKLGIKSSLASLKDTGEDLVESDYKTTEGVISAAFRAWKLYIGVLKFLSGSALQAGMWLSLEGAYHKEEEEIKVSNPTRIASENINIVTGQFVLKGTQIESTNITIKADTMESTAAESIYFHKDNMISGSMEIPLTGPTTPELQLAFGINNVNQKVHLNTNIYVSNRLTLDVKFAATLRGTHIEAGELKASFGELLLESVQNVMELEGHGMNLGLGLSVLPSSIGGQLRNGKRHVVDNLSGMIGTKSAEVVIANALMLNGAIMANAARDENGRYTEHGNFVMKFAELFIKHIHDYDNGYTLGVAFDFASKTIFKDKAGNRLPFESLEATLALHKGEGWTLATIGKGEVECTKPGGVCELDKVNRDVTSAQGFDMEIDIKPVFLYYTTLRLSDFDLPTGPGDFLKKAFNKFREDLGLKSDEEKVKEIEEALDKAIKEGDKEYKGLDAESKAKADKYRKEQKAKLGEAQTIIKDSEQNKATGAKSTRAEVLGKVAAKIREIGAVYLEFSEAHPFIAKYGFSVLSGAIQTLTTGVVGLINAAKSEMIGVVAGAGMAILIQSQVKATTHLIKKYVPELDDIDAQSLATGLITGVVILSFGAAGFKSLCKDLKALASMRSMAAANGVPLAAFADDIADDAARAAGKSNVLIRNADDVINRPVTSTTAGSEAQNVLNHIPKDLDDIANSIASGHAFEKHVKGSTGKISGIETPTQLADHIKLVVRGADDFKTLKHGGQAWWHEKTKTIVVHNPNTIDGGSVFRSRNKDYFDNMK